MPKVSAFLGSHHTPHQLHGRVVLATVLAAFGLHCHLSQHLLVGLECNVQPFLGFLSDGYDTRFVAHGTEGDVPAHMAVYSIVAIDIRNGGHMVTFVDHAGKGDAVTSLCVGDISRQLLGTGMATCCQQYQL